MLATGVIALAKDADNVIVTKNVDLSKDFKQKIHNVYLVSMYLISYRHNLFTYINSSLIVNL